LELALLRYGAKKFEFNLNSPRDAEPSCTSAGANPNSRSAAVKPSSEISIFESDLISYSFVFGFASALCLRASPPAWELNAA